MRLIFLLLILIELSSCLELLIKNQELLRELYATVEVKLAGPRDLLHCVPTDLFPKMFKQGTFYAFVEKRDMLKNYVR